MTNNNKNNSGGGEAPVHQMTQSDAARIQSGQAKNDGNMSPGGFAARAQGAGDRNANANASGQANPFAAPGTGNEAGAQIGKGAGFGSAGR